MRRNHEVRIKLSAEEKSIVQTKAKILGMSISAFMRSLSIDANLVPTKIR